MILLSRFLTLVLEINNLRELGLRYDVELRIYVDAIAKRSALIRDS